MLVIICHSPGCHSSWHMTPPELGKAVLELEDGRQPEQQVVLKGHQGRGDSG